MDWTVPLALPYQSFVWYYVYGIVHYMEFGVCIVLSDYQKLKFDIFKTNAD